MSSTLSRWLSCVNHRTHSTIEADEVSFPLTMATRTPPSTTDALAADVWRVLATFGLSQIQRGPHLAILRRLGLTPGDLKVLAILDPDEPRPMRALADALSVDPSM